MIIKVRVKVGFDYDTDDGLVADEEEAIEDALEVLNSGSVLFERDQVSVVDG